jgi:hypothetical protein
MRKIEGDMTEIERNNRWKNRDIEPEVGAHSILDSRSTSNETIQKNGTFVLTIRRKTYIISHIMIEMRIY